jgi:hypothetical protein
MILLISVKGFEDRVEGKSVLAFFPVVAINQICPLILAKISKF